MFQRIEHRAVSGSTAAGQRGVAGAAEVLHLGAQPLINTDHSIAVILRGADRFRLPVLYRCECRECRAAFIDPLSKRDVQRITLAVMHTAV